MFDVSFWVSGNLPAFYSRGQSESIQPVALIVLSCENQRESPLKYFNSIPGDQFGQEFSHMFHLIASSRLYETNPQSPAYNELDLSKASSTATRASHKSSKSSMRPCLISLALGWSLQVG
jgi:hypothetical protein